MSCIEEETGVTTVVILPWLYHCEYVHIGVCGCIWVVLLGVCCEEPYVCAGGKR